MVNFERGLPRLPGQNCTPVYNPVRLSSGILVPQAVHDELFEHVKVGIRRLSYRRPYKARDMLEPNYYFGQDPWQVGGSVADWERHRDISVRFLGCPYCSVRFYERI